MLNVAVVVVVRTLHRHSPVREMNRAVFCSSCLSLPWTELSRIKREESYQGDTKQNNVVHSYHNKNSDSLLKTHLINL